MKLSEIIKSENTVVHCMTENEAKELCIEMHKLGLKWHDGVSYIEDTRYFEYICYNPNNGTYLDKFECICSGIGIIPFRKVEFDNGTKQDSITGEISMHPILSDRTPIDWEQRTYEVAKDVLGALACRDGMTSDYEYNTETAIEYAHELIKQLKKYNNEN